MFNSYSDYVKDASLTKYGADLIGTYINHASHQQIEAINELGKSIGFGFNILSNQLSDINQNLEFLNVNMGVLIEQQKLSNLLLQNIAQLLRVPESEKERKHQIELGIKFFVNASKDVDLFVDALEAFLQAETLMKQDYFVLHRIGTIYLHVEKLLNPEKALDYFLRAAKYSSVESDTTALSLVSQLTTSEIDNKEKKDFKSQIDILTAMSYEKAAFSAYVIGNFDNSVTFQSKAVKFNPTSENKFLLAKYQVRNNNVSEGLENLNNSINANPYMALAAFKEIDLINEPEVLKLIENKNFDINNKITALIECWMEIDSSESAVSIKELNELLYSSFEKKVLGFNQSERKKNTAQKNIIEIKDTIDEYIEKIKNTILLTLEEDDISELVKTLQLSKELPYEQIIHNLNNCKKIIDNDKLKIGSKYEGGIVIYIDHTRKHGLVCSESELGKSIWGATGNYLGVDGNSIGNGIGLQNTNKIINDTWKKGDFIFRPIFGNSSAAKLCSQYSHNGYNDWYLPTSHELDLICKNKKKLPHLYDDTFWSSTEVYYKEDYAKSICFKENKWLEQRKDVQCHVIAVREF